MAIGAVAVCTAEDVSGSGYTSSAIPVNHATGPFSLYLYLANGNLSSVKIYYGVQDPANAGNILWISTALDLEPDAIGSVTTTGAWLVTAFSPKAATHIKFVFAGTSTSVSAVLASGRQ